MSTHLFEIFICLQLRRTHARALENYRQNYRRARRALSRNVDDDGFTILQILVVVTIIGLLIGLVAPDALRRLGGARVIIAKQSIERLGMVLDPISTWARTRQPTKAWKRWSGNPSRQQRIGMVHI